MASRNLDKFWSRTDAFAFGAKFRPNGASAISNALSPGATMARTGTGVITITLADKWYDWESFVAVLHAPAANETLEVTSIDMPNRTIVLTTKISGAAADLPLATNKYVSVAGKFLRSSRVP